MVGKKLSAKRPMKRVFYRQNCILLSFHIECTLKSAFSNKDFARRNHPLQQNGSFFTHQLQLGMSMSNSVPQSLGKGGPLASV